MILFRGNGIAPNTAGRLLSGAMFKVLVGGSLKGVCFMYAILF
jgi:hypothetical protein